jgi:hypothetical protein
VPKTVSIANVRGNSEGNQGNVDMKSFSGVKPIEDEEEMMSPSIREIAYVMRSHSKVDVGNSWAWGVDETVMKSH